MTENDILVALDRAIAPRSAYVADETWKIAHKRNVPLPTTAVILRRLRSLASRGYVECVGGPDGFYGYEWAITPAGRAALQKDEQSEVAA